MPTPALALPADPRVTALRGLIALLRRDPDLARVVKTWRVWDGSDGEAADPTLAQCPWVRLTATPLPAELLHGLVSEQPVQVEVETALAGTNTDHSLLLWGALERALFKGGPAAHHAVGISRIDVKQPGWGQVDGAARMVLGHGIITYSTAVPLEGV